MRLLTDRVRHWLLLSVGLALLGSCAQYQPSSTAIEDTLSSVSFDPPPREQAAAPVVRVNPGADPSAPQAETYFGGAKPNSSNTSTKAADGVAQINFDGADVREVVQFILGDTLGKTYTYDSNISGEVVLSSSGPLSENELLGVLETILRMHGGTLVQNGDGFVVEAFGGNSGGSQVAVLGGQEPPRASPGLGFTVVPLRYMTADAAAQFVQPLVTRPEQIRVDSTRNLLLFAGSGAERQAVLDTLNDVDLDWMAGRSVGIFPLSMSTPEAIIAELEALFGPLDPNGLRSETIRFLPMARLNAVLVIANEPSQLGRAKTWVSRLDRGNTVGMQFYVYQLQHVPAEQMAKLLTESISGIEEPENGSGVGQAANNVASDPFAQAGGEGIVPADGFQGTTAVGAAASGALLQSVKIVPNSLNNTLLIRSAPQAYEMIEATLRRLDTAPLQVLIEATIAEVTLNDQLRYGVQYFLNAGNFRAGFNTTSSTASGVADSSLLSPLTRLPGFNFVFTPGSSNITLDALARVTDLKVLSSPSLVVQDNSEAVLNVGDEVPIVTRSATNVDTTDSVIVNNVEYRDTGVILEVKPRISSNSMVSLEISQEVSRVATETSVQADSLTPTIQQRKINSTINVLSGQTIVLGGLIQDSESLAKDKVPVLGDVPVLGNLFQNNNNQAIRTELIVFITPRIIRNAEDARDVSDELRSRMRSVNPLPSTQEIQNPPEPANDPGAPTPLPVPSAAAPAEGSRQEGHLAVGDTPAVPSVEPVIGALLRPASSGATLVAEQRIRLPVPAPDPIIPQANPKRPARVALPLPANISRDGEAVPVPSERPVPGFQLAPLIRPGSGPAWPQNG